MNWVLIFTFLIGRGEDAMVKTEYRRATSYKDCLAQAEMLMKEKRRSKFKCEQRRL